MSEHVPERYRPCLAELVGKVITRLAERGDQVEVERADDASVAALAQLAVDRSLDDILERVTAHRDERSLEWVLVELLPAIARRLGDDWELDERSFADVTLGIGTLQWLLRRLEEDELEAPATRELIVLTAPPEEQHTLGVHVLAHQLRREGWSVHVQVGMTLEEVLELVETEAVAAIGLSVSRAERVDEVVAFCTALRGRSGRPDLPVLIGGAADLDACARRAEAVWCRDALEAGRWLRDHIAAE